MNYRSIAQKTKEFGICVYFTIYTNMLFKSVCG